MMAIMGDRRLSPRAKNVAFVLLNHLNTETLRCDPKVKSIGEQCCASERTVCGALAELRGCEWLEQRRRRGSSTFTFNFRRSDDPQKPAGLMPGDPQEPADHGPADPQDRAGLDKQDPAGLDTQKPAALTKTDNSETGKLKPGKKLLRRPAASDADTDLAFGEWWPHYPKKIEK